MESLFLEPLRETKIGLRNQEFKIVGVKYSKTNPKEVTFGSSYLEVQEVEGFHSTSV